VELRHLRYFAAVGEVLHFGRAAAALGIAQPSLSQQIQQLERDLEATLLSRTKRRVQLTEAGRLFLEEARGVLARVDRAALVARRATLGEAGTLRVAVANCMDQRTITRIVSRFGRRHPGVRVELQTMAVPLQVAALRGERLDVGFLRPPVRDPDLGWEILVDEPLVMALPAAHRLASRKHVRLRDASDERFVLVPRDAVPVYHDLVLAACRQSGFVPHALHEADHLHLILGLVAAGSGLALVPACARRIRPSGVTLRSLPPPVPLLQTAVAWRRRDLSPLTEGFLAVARQASIAGRRRGRVSPRLSSSP
jgi:DNA-binding transcriptional LysR family regulator